MLILQRLRDNPDYLSGAGMIICVNLQPSGWYYLGSTSRGSIDTCQALERGGYISDLYVEESPIFHWPDCWFHITGQGEEYLLQDRAFKLVTPDSVQVTGITSSAEGECQVEFTMHVMATPLGNYISSCGLSWEPIAHVSDGTASGTACFKLYDDGWRITEVTFP